VDFQVPSVKELGQALVNATAGPSTFHPSDEDLSLGIPVSLRSLRMTDW
jgi:hypothetical protein